MSHGAERKELDAILNENKTTRGRKYKTKLEAMKEEETKVKIKKMMYVKQIKRRGRATKENKEMKKRESFEKRK